MASLVTSVGATPSEVEDQTRPPHSAVVAAGLELAGVEKLPSSLAVLARCRAWGDRGRASPPAPSLSGLISLYLPSSILLLPCLQFAS